MDNFVGRRHFSHSSYPRHSLCGIHAFVSAFVGFVKTVIIFKTVIIAQGPYIRHLPGEKSKDGVTVEVDEMPV